MLKLSHVDVAFRSERRDNLFGHEKIQILSDICFDVKKGSCLGILGESGSGKSTLGRVICGMEKPSGGEMFFHRESVYKSRRAKRHLQGAVSVVFQDYTMSANPRFRIGRVIEEGLLARRKRERMGMNVEQETDRLMDMVGLPREFKERYPHELSGGQLQRVCIARAVACAPQFILFDEAVSSLDAHTQIQVMDLLCRLQKELDLTYIFITHDLTSVTYMCDKVLFLYKGRVTEHCSVSCIGQTKDPYAQRLLSSILL